MLFYSELLSFTDFHIVCLAIILILIRSTIFKCILVLTILLIGLLALPLLFGSRKGVCWMRDVWVKFIISSLKIIVGLD